MKTWNNYGSEHSMNLVMIGHFKDAGSAEAAKDALEELQAFFGSVESDPKPDRFDRNTMDVLERLKFHSVAAGELEQFRYDINVKSEGNDVVITTDEIDVSAFLKYLIDNGAKVEVYSAHDHKGTGKGRDTSND